MDEKIQFLLRRASEESLKAMTSNEPLAADAHDGLAIRYSAKAIIALADSDEPAGLPEGERPDTSAPSKTAPMSAPLRPRA